MNILKHLGQYLFFNELVLVDRLEPKNYIFNFGPTGSCYLTDMTEFHFPEKVYDTGGELRELVKKGFAQYRGNLGVLLAGAKGQGKSLTAKMICKDLGLPVIIIGSKIPKEIDFIGFLQGIEQDYVLYIDEFEKLFLANPKTDAEHEYHSQESFLSFMDGAISSDRKILFLLTANEGLNEYLINRPSRIRYLKNYDEMPEELFNQIVSDLLKFPEYKEDLIENISLLNLNVDLLISILEDINFHGKPFSAFKDEFNYKFESYRYDVFMIEGTKEKFVRNFTHHRKPKYTDQWLAGYTVEGFIKITKEEVSFTTSVVEENDDDDDDDTKKKVVIKMVPVKQMPF